MDGEEGIMDQMEREIEEYKAFLFKKGLMDEYDKWLESDESEEDIEEYEKATEQESDEFDPSTI